MQDKKSAFTDFSEHFLRDNCPHCDRSSWAYDYMLEETDLFSVLCDCNPLIEGHILIIPKRHVSCIGEYTPDELSEFKQHYSKISKWIAKEYGSIATFEHGKIGQTVFHSHIHLMPFKNGPKEIIPEGIDKLKPLYSIDALTDLFHKERQYLFFSIGSNMWSVDTSLGAPRFFRDRFAKALNCPERANWKETRKDTAILAAGHKDNIKCQGRFKK